MNTPSNSTGPDGAPSRRDFLATALTLVSGAAIAPELLGAFGAESAAIARPAEAVAATGTAWQFLDSISGIYATENWHNSQVGNISQRALNLVEVPRLVRDGLPPSAALDGAMIPEVMGSMMEAIRLDPADPGFKVAVAATIKMIADAQPRV